MVKVIVKISASFVKMAFIIYKPERYYMT